MTTPPAQRVRIALGQYDIGWHDAAGSLVRAGRVIARAAKEGADLVVLPETSMSGFTMESAQYAEPLAGPSVTGLSRLAAEHGIYVLAGVATSEPRDGRAVFNNSALLFEAGGELAGHYRKQRLFALGGEDEAYEPGGGPQILNVMGVPIAAFICYDLRFPELFRAVGPHVDAIILIANWPARRRLHWDVLVQARAIENQCYIVAVNRVGEGGGVRYDGGSVAYDPWGERLCMADDGDAASDGLLCAVTVEPSVVTRVRTEYPFSVDRRTLRGEHSG